MLHEGGTYVVFCPGVRETNVSLRGRKLKTKGTRCHRDMAWQRHWFYRLFYALSLSCNSKTKCSDGSRQRSILADEFEYGESSRNLRVGLEIIETSPNESKETERNDGRYVGDGRSAVSADQWFVTSRAWGPSSQENIFVQDTSRNTVWKSPSHYVEDVCRARTKKGRMCRQHQVSTHVFSFRWYSFREFVREKIKSRETITCRIMKHF